MTSPFFTDKHHDFRSRVREFVKKEVLPFANDWEKRERIPRRIWHKMGENQLLGLNVPEAFGGLEADFFHSVILLEGLMRGTMGGFVASVTMHQFMALTYLQKFGSQWIKRNYLMPGVFGEKVGALAIAEPGAGSDVAALKTRARLDDGAYVINGEKSFVTNGIFGDFFVLAAKTDALAGTNGISLFIVDADAEGLQAKKMRKIGWDCADIAEVVFKNVRVPESNRIGQENLGFYYIMDCFLLERLVAAIASVAGADLCLENTLDYINKREAFNRKLAKFQAIRHHLADLAAEVEAARHLTYQACWQYQQGYKGIQLCTMAKLFSAELMKKAADVCLQYFGGYGFSKENVVSRFFRDSRAASLVGGTSEIMREIIAKLIVDNTSKTRKHDVKTKRISLKSGPEKLDRTIGGEPLTRVNPIKKHTPLSKTPSKIPNTLKSADAKAGDKKSARPSVPKKISLPEENPLKEAEILSEVERVLEETKPMVEKSSAKTPGGDHSEEPKNIHAPLPKKGQRQKSDRKTDANPLLANLTKKEMPNQPGSDKKAYNPASDKKKPIEKRSVEKPAAEKISLKKLPVDDIINPELEKPSTFVELPLNSQDKATVSQSIDNDETILDFSKLTKKATSQTDNSPEAISRDKIKEPVATAKETDISPPAEEPVIDLSAFADQIKPEMTDNTEVHLPPAAEALPTSDNRNSLKDEKGERQGIVGAITENFHSEAPKKATEKSAQPIPPGKKDGKKTAPAGATGVFGSGIDLGALDRAVKASISSRESAVPGNYTGGGSGSKESLKEERSMNTSRPTQFTAFGKSSIKQSQNLSVAEIIESLPERLKTKNSQYRAAIYFKISGNDGGEYTVRVQDGKCEVQRGLVGKVNCRVETNVKTYIEMETGKTNPQIAFMMGKLMISNVPAMMQFTKMFKKLPDI